MVAETRINTDWRNDERARRGTGWRQEEGPRGLRTHPTRSPRQGPRPGVREFCAFEPTAYGCASHMCRHARLGYPCRRRPQSERPRTEIAQNEPNLPRPRAPNGGNCAKRSQTWGDWGMWAKIVVVWSAARPGSEVCKTNPISGPGGHRLRIADWKTPAGMASVQNEANFGIESCETNQISPAWGRPSEGKCAKQTQFGDERIYTK
jgi:hypothetical protein